MLNSESNACMTRYCWTCGDSLLPGAACVINSEMLFICLSPAGAGGRRDGRSLAFHVSFVLQLLFNSRYCAYVLRCIAHLITALLLESLSKTLSLQPLIDPCTFDTTFGSGEKHNCFSQPLEQFRRPLSIAYLATCVPPRGVRCR